MALEVSDLIKEYEVSDTLNNDITTQLIFSNPFECPCIELQKCERTNNLFEYLNTLSNYHPQRKGLITYLRTQICDVKMGIKWVKCCGKQVGIAPSPRTPTPLNPQLPSGEKVYHRPS